MCHGMRTGDWLADLDKTADEVFDKHETRMLQTAVDDAVPTFERFGPLAIPWNLVLISSASSLMAGFVLRNLWL